MNQFSRWTQTSNTSDAPWLKDLATPVTLQSGDSLEITERVTFDGGVERVTFADLITRIQALTGLNARQASVIAGEILELRGEWGPFNPPDHLIVYKAKELGYLPDNWRLP